MEISKDEDEHEMPVLILPKQFYKEKGEKVKFHPTHYSSKIEREKEKERKRDPPWNMLKKVNVVASFLYIRLHFLDPEKKVQTNKRIEYKIRR